MIWRNKSVSFIRKRNNEIDYLDVCSAIKPVHHGEGLPFPAPSLVKLWGRFRQLYNNVKLDYMLDKKDSYFHENEGKKLN